MIRFSNQPGDSREHLFRALGPVTDLEPRVHQAQQDDLLREHRFPGHLGRFPAVGVHGLGGMLGGHVAGLVLEDLGGGLQVVGCRRLGSHTAAVADGRGDLDLLVSST